jgi:catechol 2,3-dioxygenase-like lactoylglutathione lyase family enzyme
MYRAIALFCLLISACFSLAQQAKSARPAITGISHMTLYADDFSKSQHFYTDLLGWEQIPDGRAESGVRFYANHQQYIELLSAPSAGMADRSVLIGFSTSDAESMRSYLAAGGISVPSSVTTDRAGNKSFEVKDPEGHRIEFTQQGSHPPTGVKATSARVSTHIIHAGLVARDRAALDRFYKDLLGFHLYWQGGATSAHTDWVMMQVPEGTDWLEYMLYLPVMPSRSELAGANHFSPGVVSVADLDKRLKQHGWVPSAQERPPLLGLDGKWQLDLFDPDGTRVEFMEFETVKDPCCSAFTGPEAAPFPAW